MILERVILNIVDQQQRRLLTLDAGLKRELVPAMQSISSHALIISGVRRCGKSTFLMQMIKKRAKKEVFYLNFESPHLYDFSIDDFSRLDNVITQKGSSWLFFDELQLVKGWEMYVRQKLDEGYKVVISGSNASLLSSELGSKLTGRHITQELFPFSYSEYLTYRKEKASVEGLKTYMQTGGFPEYVKTGDEEQLSTLFNDLLVRDIVARYGIKDIKSLQRLASYLVSNVGNRISATKLKQPLSIAATSTILNWFSYLEQSYLVFFVPLFSHSVKAQIINPRKVYIIDPGMIHIVSNAMTDDLGRKLENLVFLHLRRNFKELYYFDDNGECDFVAMRNGIVAKLVQVCYELTPENIKREINGLLKAMQFFKVPKGEIITLSESDTIRKEGYEIAVIPAYKYLGKS